MTEHTHTPSGGVRIDSWTYPNGYHYRKLITIPANDYDLTRFRLIVSVVVPSAFVFVGSDFIMTTLDNNLLDTDIRSYDPVSGLARICVKASISSQTDTQYYLYSGKRS